MGSPYPTSKWKVSFYSQQSIRIEPGDMILMFSDGATNAFSPGNEMLTAEGFLELADKTLAKFSSDFPLHLFVEALVNAIRNFHGTDDLEDGLTMLTLRRPFTSVSPEGYTVSEGHNR